MKRLALLAFFALAAAPAVHAQADVANTGEGLSEGDRNRFEVRQANTGGPGNSVDFQQRGDENTLTIEQEGVELEATTPAQPPSGVMI